MASWQTLVFSTTTETHTLHPHFHSKCGGCKYSLSFDVSTVDDAIFGGNDRETSTVVMKTMMATTT
jgi:hypothetical protein